MQSSVWNNQERCRDVMRTNKQAKCIVHERQVAKVVFDFRAYSILRIPFLLDSLLLLLCK